jgi:opacity protein-like surface antigen
MNKFVGLLAAVSGLSSAGIAHAGTPYAGVEGGVSYGRVSDVDEHVSFVATQNPSTPVAPAPPAASEFDDVFAVRYDRGYDVGLIGGYDFGYFRLELELAQKKAGLGKLKSDDITEEFLTSLNSALNRPSAAPDPAAPGQPALAIDDFDLSGGMRIRSAMINGFGDLGITKRLFAYGGGGYGRTWTRALGDSDSAWGWQWMAGLRYALNPKVELGLRYRYFNSGIMTLQHDPQVISGNANRLTVSGTDVDQTVNANVVQEIEGEIRSRSLLATLMFNL